MGSAFSFLPCGCERLAATANGGAGRDTLQFVAEEFLHGLALECRAPCEFIADFLGHTPDPVSFQILHVVIGSWQITQFLLCSPLKSNWRNWQHLKTNAGNRESSAPWA